MLKILVNVWVEEIVVAVCLEKDGGDGRRSEKKIGDLEGI